MLARQAIDANEQVIDYKNAVMRKNLTDLYRAFGPGTNFQYSSYAPSPPTPQRPVPADLDHFGITPAEWKGEHKQKPVQPTNFAPKHNVAPPHSYNEDINTLNAKAGAKSYTKDLGRISEETRNDRDAAYADVTSKFPSAAKGSKGITPKKGIKFEAGETLASNIPSAAAKATAAANANSFGTDNSRSGNQSASSGSYVAPNQRKILKRGTPQPSAVPGPSGYRPPATPRPAVNIAPTPAPRSSLMSSRTSLTSSLGLDKYYDASDAPFTPKPRSVYLEQGQYGSVPSGPSPQPRDRSPPQEQAAEPESSAPAGGGENSDYEDASEETYDSDDASAYYDVDGSPSESHV